MPWPSGKPCVNPLRVACVLDSPNILLVADTALLAQLPTEQKNLLMDWAISHELTVVDSVRDFRIKMGNEPPDILYVFARFEGEALLHLGEESITSGADPGSLGHRQGR